MVYKGLFESKSGSREGEPRKSTQNIVDNLNNYEEFAVTAWSLRYHFTTLMKKYKSKTRHWRQEIANTGLEGEAFSENEQLPEDLLERF